MPRADDPRVMVRLDPALYGALKATAERANVAVAALIRECAERAYEGVAADVASGALRLRRGRVEVAEAAAPVVRASSLVVGQRAMSAALERQMRLNEAAARARKAKPVARRKSL